MDYRGNTMCDLNEVMAILRSALFEESCHSNTKNIEEVLTELEKQTVLPLVFPVLPQLGLTADRYEYWEDQIYSYIITNQTVMDAEKKAVGLLHENHIPCVILKGSSYAQYYPHPELRVRGDIDILVNESDFETAADLLIKDGFTSNTTPQKSPGARHIEYFKNGIEIELHRYFSDADKTSEYLAVSKAQLSESGIPCFPPAENGISMLLHFRFHLGRSGLRHYMDWIMYVSRVCDDVFWNKVLKEKAETFGVADLAKTLTKAGKKYFPLSQITWCDDADDAESAALLNGFFEAENFNANLSKKKAITIASSGKSPLYWVKFITDRGIKNWKPAQKSKLLVPAAFIRQVYKYAKWYIKENGLNLNALKNDTKKVESMRERFK